MKKPEILVFIGTMIIISIIIVGSYLSVSKEVNECNKVFGTEHTAFESKYYQKTITSSKINCCYRSEYLENNMWKEVEVCRAIN